MSLREVFSSVKESFKFKKNVIIKDVTYELTVLSMGQERKVNLFLDGLKQDDSLEYLNELKRSVISEAITAINGESLGKTIKDTDKDGKEVEKDRVIFLKEFLCEIPSGIVTELFDAYIDAKDQSDDMLKKEMKYDWFKTPEQREKENEDLRKKEELKKEEKIEDVKLTKVVETPDKEEA
jgi:hypothetical protein